MRNADLKKPEPGMDIRYCFTRPRETPEAVLDQISDLVVSSGGVGTSWIKENLQTAFLVGYALCEDRVVGTSTHKYPKERYRKKIEAETGLDLSNYLNEDIRQWIRVPEPGHRFEGYSGINRKIRRAKDLRHHRHG